MKSLLILTPRFPYPVVGGDRLRIYQICKVLSAHYRLTLLSLCESEDEMKMTLPNDNVFLNVERFYLPRWRSWLNCLIAMPSQKPLQVAYYHLKSFQARALELMREHDAALAHLIRVGDAIKSEPGVKFLEMTDAISLNYQRIRKTSQKPNDLRAVVYAFEAGRLRKYEQNIVDSFDHSFLVSEIDREHLFSGFPARKSKVSVFSNGVDLDGMPYQFSSTGRDIIFIGNMYSLQNLDAAIYMATDVLPLIRSARPDVRLRLIGRIKSEHAEKLSCIEGVDVTGEVPNVAQAAIGGGVGVCPLRLGAGVQNKVLEYMALGLPTVSTTMGLEGFHAADEREILIADDTQEFANSVMRLLSNKEVASRIAAAARQYVEATHSWNAMLDPLVQLIQKRINAAPD